MRRCPECGAKWDEVRLRFMCGRQKVPLRRCISATEAALRAIGDEHQWRHRGYQTHARGGLDLAKILGGGYDDL
jgi:hypothetical protein